MLDHWDTNAITADVIGIVIPLRKSVAVIEPHKPEQPLVETGEA